jgi:hypothetical protein
LTLCASKMVQGSTLGVDPESIRIDVRVAWEFAACYGVNLAVSVVVLGFSSARCEAVTIQSRRRRAEEELNSLREECVGGVDTAGFKMVQRNTSG